MNQLARAVFPGSELEINTHGLARGGAAVGRTDSGFVVFVQGAAPNERVRVRIESVKKNLAFAKLISVLNPSKSRVEPPCQYFGSCGGCCWQHVDSMTQLTEKQRMVEKALARATRAAPVNPIIASPKAYRYRDRVSLNIEQGRPTMKLRGSSKSLAIDDCLIAAEGLIDKARMLAEQDLGLKRVAVKRNAGLEADQAHSSDAAEAWEDGFTQVNPEQNQALITWLVRQVDLVGLSSHQNLRIVDLYCGDGNLSLPLIEAIVRHNTSVELYGCDLGQESIQRAQARLKSIISKLGLLGADLFRYEAKDCKLGVETARAFFKDIQLVILDPPRIGADSSVIRNLTQLQSKWLCYVSCDPMTLARDLERLSQALHLEGRDLRYHCIQPFDFFPQTDHVEVAVFAELVALPSRS